MKGCGLHHAGKNLRDKFILILIMTTGNIRQVPSVRLCHNLLKNLNSLLRKSIIRGQDGILEPNIETIKNIKTVE